MISFSQILSSSKESFKSIGKKNNLVSKVSQEIKTYDSEDLLNNCSEKIKDIWAKIYSILSKSDFDSTKFITKPKYIRFASDTNKIICYFNFRKDHLLIHIMGGTIYGDGSKGKFFVDIDDYKNKLKKKERVWKGYGDSGRSGSKKSGKDPVHYEYEIKIKDENEINYLIEMLKQRYKAVNI